MSGITDSAKFNNSTSYYVPKVPAPGAGDVITGNLQVTGTLEVGGAVTIDGALTATDGTLNVSPNIAIAGTTTSTGLITATAGVTSTGLVTANGGLTVVGSSTLQATTATSLIVPAQPSMGTSTTPIVFNLTPVSNPTATLNMVGNKAYFTINNAIPPGVVTLTVTSSAITSNSVVPIIYSITGGTTYTPIGAVLVPNGGPLLFASTNASEEYCLILV
jgi:hypothetical protein